ncbi:MAG: S8 family serine peptidase, partial [Clostridia bacterium]|nr:S8 family serine peptidase [Clostridia bacterium]
AEPEAGSAISPIYAPDLLGLDEVHAAGLRGEGVLVAVIDTGFDLSHPVFTMPAGTEPAMTIWELAEIWPLLSFNSRLFHAPQPAALYVSDKVAFAYDYVGTDIDVSAVDIHGTHVASILAGGADASGEFVGVAPAAQLALMKVFSDGDKAVASDYAVYRAVEDAVLLGADVISLSLGSAPGYPYATNTFSLYRHLEQAREMGCAVICAVGNDGAVGAGSVYDRAYEIDYPLAANPDYGLVADPASYATTLAVGAYTPDRVLQTGLGSGDGEIFSFTDSAVGQGFTDMRFDRVLAGQTLAYVAVPGVGAAADYAGLDLTGRLALVRRGEITFTEKLLAARDAGAVGMICYNNEAGDEVINMAFDEMPIPAVSITLAEGERLLGLVGEARTVTVSDDIVRLTEPEGAGRPASYSTVSSGTVIRPSVSAPGTVYAAVPGGGYRSVAGTSMATPTAAGLCALALGRRLAEEIEGWDTAALDELAAQLITTAAPMLDEEGYPYSVRVQGGGAVQAEAFLRSATALRASDGRGVIELGDGLADDGQFVLEFSLTNRAGVPVRYTVTASVGSDAYLLHGEDEAAVFASDRMRVFTEAAVVLEGINVNRYADGVSGYTLTLAPGETRVLRASVTLSPEEAEEYRTYFVNGYYLEGYIWAESGEGEQLSLPYLGFAGVFAELPYLDNFGYDGGESFFPQNYLLGEASGKLLNLGVGYYGGDGVFRSDLIAISPDGDGWLDEAQVNLYLLRNLYSFEIEVTDASGVSVMHSKRSYYLPKTFLGEDDRLQASLMTAWDGRDDGNVDYIMPDGHYTVTFRVFGMGDVVEEEISLPIVVDTAAPELVKTEISEENGVRRLKLTLRDSHYPMRAVLYRTETDAYGREVDLYRDDHNISYREGRRSIALTYDITGLEVDYLYLDVYDYALNRHTYRVPLG